MHLRKFRQAYLMEFKGEHQTRGMISLLSAVVALASVVVYLAQATGDAAGETAPLFGIKIPPGYRDWKLISVADEEGNLNDLAPYWATM